jgi:NAD(P)H-hydrate epimerase
MTVNAFRTMTGLVVPAITTDQMREVDRLAIEEIGPTFTR